MGYFSFGLSTDLKLAVHDAFFYSVYNAAKDAIQDRDTIISFCAFSPDLDRYLKIKVACFVPELIGTNGKKVAEEAVFAWLKPHSTGGELDADPTITNQILETMEHTDGCIVIGTDHKPILDAREAQKIISTAATFDPFKDIIFPNPSH